MSRADVPEEYRRDFCLYVDEFQNFSTESFADILSQARKYHLNLIVANQFTTQLSDEIRDAVFGNVGTVVSYRVGTNDAEFLAKQFAPVFDIEDLQFIPNYNMVVRMMIGGVPVQPFSMSALPPLGSPNKQLADALKQLSWAKYGRPRAEVERTIFDRLKTEVRTPMGMAGGQPNLPPGAGSPWASLPSGSAGLPPGAGRPPALSSSPFGPVQQPTSLPSGLSNGGSGNSFLDEWLAKRKPTTPSGASPAFLPPPAARQPHIEPVNLSTASPSPSQAGQAGELKINRTSEPQKPGELVTPTSDQGQSVRIDKDGNINPI